MPQLKLLHRRTSPQIGIEATRKVIQTLGRVSDDVLTNLKSAEPISSWLSGTGKVARYGAKFGINPELMARILGNDNLYSAGYKQADLLEDMGELANVKGFELLADALSYGNKTILKENKGVIGFRWELEATAELSRRGIEIIELTKKVYSKAGKLETDIDAIIRDGGKYIYLQLKASNALVGGVAGKAPLGSLDDVKAWVAKALTDLKKLDPAATSEQIKYVVPQGTIIPRGIEEWFSDPKIGIEVIRDILLK